MGGFSYYSAGLVTLGSRRAAHLLLRRRKEARARFFWAEEFSGYLIPPVLTF